MSALSQTIGELMLRDPGLASFIASADGGAAKPDVPVADWIAGLDEEDLAELGLNRQQVAAHVLACVAELDAARAPSATLSSLRILGGCDKLGRTEKLDLVLRPGEIICIVGPTGSGKSRLLADIECLAQGDTPSGRKILVDGEISDPARRWAAAGKLVAQLSQNMNFVVDMSVGDFIAMHAECRGAADVEASTREVIACANDLAGERFSAQSSLTQLSGGQSRALMIADVALLSASPIVLIDEIENAGIDRKRALNLLVASDKIVLISTHDPILALLGQRRVVVANGAVASIVESQVSESRHLEALEQYDGLMRDLREKLRQGGRIDELPAEFTAFASRQPARLKMGKRAWMR